MDNIFKEQLKNAICNNDLLFLTQNKDKFSINLRFEDEDNDSLLLYAISDRGCDTYNYLLANGADTTVINDEGEGILHAIIYSGMEDRLIDFMNRYSFDINACAVGNVTPLLLALSLEKNRMANILINKGADVNIGDIEGITPLHLAVQSKDLELVTNLINHGANLHVKTKMGNYPLALAINADCEEIVRYLYPMIYK